MTSSNRLSYIVGLDGIRALAVMAVLFYHAEAPWALITNTMAVSAATAAIRLPRTPVVHMGELSAERG